MDSVFLFKVGELEPWQDAACMVPGTVQLNTKYDQQLIRVDSLWTGLSFPRPGVKPVFFTYANRIALHIIFFFLIMKGFFFVYGTSLRGKVCRSFWLFFLFSFMTIASLLWIFCPCLRINFNNVSGRNLMYCVLWRRRASPVSRSNCRSKVISRIVPDRKTV